MNRKVILILAATVVLIIGLAAFIDTKAGFPSVNSINGITYEVISTQDYIRDGQKCIGYRVYIDTRDVTYSEYRAIFCELTDNDGKYLHTVWFYFNKDSANGTDIANVTMEQTVRGIIPDPVK